MKKSVFYSMKYRALMQVFDNNTIAFADKPQAIVSKQAFSALITEMKSILVTLEVPVTTINYSKVQFRKSLTHELGKALSVGIMFAHRAGDESIMNTLKDFNRRYRSVSTARKINMATYFIDLITSLQEIAEDAGLKAEDVLKLKDLVEKYELAENTVSNTMGNRIQSRNRITELIKECNKILSLDLDRFVRHIAEEHPTFYYEYFRIRHLRLRKPSGSVLTTTSSISGMVTNEVTGLPIPGATLNLIEHAYAITTLSDGYYLFDDLEAAAFNVTCHATGFEVPSPLAVTLKNNDSVIFDFKLKPRITQ